MGFPDMKGQVILNCRYRTATDYRRAAFGLGLTEEGAYRLAVETILPRYVGVVELSSPDGPLLDILFDATETPANPAILTCVKRSHLSAGNQPTAESLVNELLGSRLHG
jgi:hypothetical protein